MVENELEGELTLQPQRLDSLVFAIYFSLHKSHYNCSHRNSSQEIKCKDNLSICACQDFVEQNLKYTERDTSLRKHFIWKIFNRPKKDTS